MLGEQDIDLVAVGDVVGVAVLVPGARDQGRPCLCEGLGPGERVRDTRDGVEAVDVVTGVAAGAKHERARQRRPHLAGELVCRQCRRIIGGQKVVGAEVGAEEDQVVMAAEERGREVGSAPRAGGARGQ